MSRSRLNWYWWANIIVSVDDYRFQFAHPTTGTWKAAKTTRKAIELNSPLQVVELDRQSSGSEHLPTSNSLIDLNSSDLVLTAFKPSETGNSSWIFRCYECHGNETEINLTGNLNLKLDRPVNLLEEPLTDTPDPQKIKPWQIRSFKIDV